MLSYLGLFASAAAFEFAYVAWARSVAHRHHGALVVFWSTATAALGLIGVGGALRLHLGAIAYLGGIAVGSAVSAYIGRRSPG